MVWRSELGCCTVRCDATCCDVVRYDATRWAGRVRMDAVRECCAVHGQGVNGLVHGRVNGRVNDRVNGRVNGHVDGRVNGCVSGRCEWPCAWPCEWPCEWTCHPSVSSHPRLLAIPKDGHGQVVQDLVHEDPDCVAESARVPCAALRRHSQQRQQSVPRVERPLPPASTYPSYPLWCAPPPPRCPPIAPIVWCLTCLQCSAVGRIHYVAGRQRSPCRTSPWQPARPRVTAVIADAGGAARRLHSVTVVRVNRKCQPAARPAIRPASRRGRRRVAAG